MPKAFAQESRGEGALGQSNRLCHNAEYVAALLRLMTLRYWDLRLFRAVQSARESDKFPAMNLQLLHADDSGTSAPRMGAGP